MALAFRWDGAPIWFRLIGATTMLGLLGAPFTGDLWNAKGILPGILIGLAFYGAARIVLGLEICAAQAAQIRTWASGVPICLALATIPLGVAGEELYWRGAFSKSPYLGAVFYAAAQAPSGLWILPAAALGIGVVWAFLAQRTRSLIGPIASHLVLDVLVILTFVGKEAP